MCENPMGGRGPPVPPCRRQWPLVKKVTRVDNDRGRGKLRKNNFVQVRFFAQTMFSISNVIDCLDSSRLLITVLFICSLL